MVELDRLGAGLPVGLPVELGLGDTLPCMSGARTPFPSLFCACHLQLILPTGAVPVFSICPFLVPLSSFLLFYVF